MSKRFIAVIGAVILTLVLATVVSAGDVFVRIGTGSVGGGFYQIGNTIAQLGNRDMKGFNFTAVTGGSKKNAFNLGTKDLEMGLIQSATLMDAYDGTGDFDGKPIKDLRFVTAIYPMPFHILVNKKAGLKSVADFKGKRVDYGPVGGGIEVNARRILSIYGITDKDVVVQRFSRSEVSEALKTGRADANIWATNIPNAMVTDMIRSGKVGLIGLGSEKTKEIVEKFPAFAPSEIPAGTYEGYDEDIPVVAAVGALITYTDMDEDTIYQITKMMYEHSDFLKERLSYFKHFGPDFALDGKVCPLHPGARRFYTEQGIIK